MPYEAMNLGAAGHVLRYRLRYQQRLSGKTLTGLSRALTELGHPITAARIGESFNGYRRITTDELTALSTALGVVAGDMLLSTSPAANTDEVDRIAALNTRDLRVAADLAGFATGDIEKELDKALTLGRRERQAAGISDPAVILDRLEANAIELELLEAELERRLGKDWASGEH